MAFRMPQKKIIQPNIQINESNIEFVENSVFLGITINNKLNWNSHINKVTNKISKTGGILNKLRSFVLGHHKNGQDGREDLKQDGGTALSAT